MILGGDVTTSPEATLATIPTSSASFVGYWETATVQATGLRVDGWALHPSHGAPQIFTVTWGDSVYTFAPDTTRPDVPRSLGWGEERCGFRTVVPFPANVMSDWSKISMAAQWADGSVFTLPINSSLRVDGLKIFSISSFAEFQESFQNPAFRIKNPALQAQGAARALQSSETDKNYWMAAATVALYRCVLDNVFPRSEAEKIIEKWNVLSPSLINNARGLELRWATSMHLASGYAHLAWKNYDQARREFTSIPIYKDRILTWPQVTTNMGIGIFIGAWLEWRAGNVEAACRVLEASTTLFQEGVGTLKIWNWHMFEELRGALNVSQMCFSLLKRLEQEPKEHIMPRSVKLHLGQVSVVMKTLIDRGLVSDEILP